MYFPIKVVRWVCRVILMPPHPLHNISKELVYLAWANNNITLVNIFSRLKQQPSLVKCTNRSQRTMTNRSFTTSISSKYHSKILIRITGPSKQI